jgi:hypothetical protein
MDRNKRAEDGDWIEKSNNNNNKTLVTRAGGEASRKGDDSFWSR